MLKSFLNGLKVSVGDLEFSLDIEPELGTADSGDPVLEIKSHGIEFHTA